MYRSPMNRPQREPEDDDNEFDFSKLILYSVGFIVVLSMLRGCMYAGPAYQGGYGGGNYYGGGGGGLGSFVSGMFLGNMLSNSRSNNYYYNRPSLAPSYGGGSSVRGGSWGSGRYSSGGFRFGK